MKKYLLSVSILILLILTYSAGTGYGIQKSFTATADSVVSFYGNWETGLVTGSGNHNWVGKIAPSNGITILSDGGAREGSKYAKIQVDNTNCTDCTERSEVYMMQNSIDSVIWEDENSGTVQYSFSVKFDPTWQNMSKGGWAIFLQMHSPDSFATTPAWALSATGLDASKEGMVFALRGGDIDYNRGDDYELSINSLNKGHWIDFLVTVKYARDKTGFVTVQRRDEGQTNYMQVINLQNVATVAWSSTRPNTEWWDHMYMRMGLYRNHENFTSILYNDGFTRTVLK